MTGFWDIPAQSNIGRGLYRVRASCIDGSRHVRDQLLIAGLCSAAISGLVAVLYWTALRRLAGRPAPAMADGTAGRLTVIIPARDEEQDLASSLESVLAQDGVRLDVILVNDHSGDRTGTIADSFAAADGRVRVMHDPELPPGWLGKANAMQQAAAHAMGDYLLFTDADIIHGPACFRTAVSELNERGLDLISYFPRIRCESVWENVLMPAYVGSLTQYATAGINDDRSSDALAAGALILVSAAAFRAVGGFESIRTELFDDLALARLVKALGYRAGCRAAPALLEVRLFKGNHHAFWGTTKNILAGMGKRIWLAPIALFVPFLVYWTPVACVAAGLWARDRPLLMVGASTYALQYATLWLGRSLFGFHPGKALLFPLVPIPIACSMIRALYLYVARGAVQWRGRVVKLKPEA
jgi:glycosyltransferase involved in cell wall biosynthesis